MAHGGPGLDEESAVAGRLDSASHSAKLGLCDPGGARGLGEHTQHIPLEQFDDGMIARPHAAEPVEDPIAVEEDDLPMQVQPEAALVGQPPQRVLGRACRRIAPDDKC